MKKKTKQTVLFVSTFFILAIAGMVIYGSDTDSKITVQPRQEKQSNPTVNEGKFPKTPADFSMELLDENGNEVSMKQFKGKVIFINIWATWCPPCIAEMPDIQEVYTEFEEDVVFLMVSVDRNFDKAKAFKKRKAYDFSVYHAKGKLPDLYTSNSIPMTYIIDSQGNLVMTYTGMGDYNSPDFKHYLKAILNK